MGKGRSGIEAVKRIIRYTSWSGSELELAIAVIVDVVAAKRGGAVGVKPGGYRFSGRGCLTTVANAHEISHYYPSCISSLDLGRDCVAGEREGQLTIPRILATMDGQPVNNIDNW